MCCMCSDTFEFSKDLHRYWRAIHIIKHFVVNERTFNQYRSLIMHASKSWILIDLIWRSNLMQKTNRQTTDIRQTDDRQKANRLVRDTRDNFLENAYFTLNQNFIFAFISYNNMYYWNDWVSSTKKFVSYDEIELWSKMKDEIRTIFENSFENFFEKEKCAHRNEECAYRNEECAYRNEKCAYW